jgi:hypothetical protein
MVAAINTTVNSNPTVPADGVDRERLDGLGAGNASLNGLRTRVNITTPTTYLLVAQAGYSSVTGTGYGALRARRMR